MSNVQALARSFLIGTTQISFFSPGTSVRMLWQAPESNQEGQSDLGPAVNGRLKCNLKNAGSQIGWGPALFSQ